MSTERSRQIQGDTLVPVFESLVVIYFSSVGLKTSRLS
jgi:hypothetical protein